MYWFVHCIIFYLDSLTWYVKQVSSDVGVCVISDKLDVFSYAPWPPPSSPLLSCNFSNIMELHNNKEHIKSKRGVQKKYVIIHRATIAALIHKSPAQQVCLMSVVHWNLHKREENICVGQSRDSHTTGPAAATIAPLWHKLLFTTLLYKGKWDFFL